MTKNQIEQKVYQDLHAKEAYLQKIFTQGFFGEIHVADGSTAQSIPTGTNYTKLTAFTENGESSNCTPDVSNDRIVVNKTGRYLIVGSISGYVGTANARFSFAIFKNNAEQHNVHSIRRFSNVNERGSISISGIVDITTIDTVIDLRSRHNLGGAVNLTLQYATISLTYLGET